jgi:hypothetical protein
MATAGDAQAALPASGSEPDDGKYAELTVHTEKLRHFARVLAGKAERLRKKSGDLEVIDHLTADRRLHGDFPEAVSLADANRQAVTVMDELVRQIGDVIAFADDVANGTAYDYETADEHAETDFAAVEADLKALTGRLS